MRKYIEQIKQRTPHERRQAAARWAVGLTAVVFVGWLATLSVRLGTPSPKTASQNALESQVASIFSAFSLQGSQPNTLEVASTTANN